jgi:hypothetical protein
MVATRRNGSRAASADVGIALAPVSSATRSIACRAVRSRSAWPALVNRIAVPAWPSEPSGYGDVGAGNERRLR